jgi:hypothetical protein
LVTSTKKKSNNVGSPSGTQQNPDRKMELKKDPDQKKILR